MRILATKATIAGRSLEPPECINSHSHCAFTPIQQAVGQETLIPSLQRERELQSLGYTRIVGVDEAGRGPLAGPVVAGAVVLSEAFCPSEYFSLDDSKKLTHPAREELFARLTATFEFGIGIVDAATIDRINIRQASWRAMQLAVADLQSRAVIREIPQPIEYVLIDGLGYGPGPWDYEAIVKGDSKSFSIAAASIVAKVTRDRLMREWDADHPGYGFAQHKGYGTSMHLEALYELGPCVLHRRSFAPVRQALGKL